VCEFEETRVLEFIVVYLLGKHNKTVVENKGHRGGKYMGITIALWFGGEILGLIVGLLLEGTKGFAVAYLFAIAGAVTGAVIAWLIAKQVPASPMLTWNPTHRTPPDGLQA
jgi:MFS family permease